MMYTAGSQFYIKLVKGKVKRKSMFKNLPGKGTLLHLIVLSILTVALFKDVRLIDSSPGRGYFFP